MDTVYTRFLRRWWWLMAIAVAIALAASHRAVGQQQPLYSAQATIQVGRTIEDKNPEQNEFAVTDRLVSTYAELTKRDPILNAAARSLNLPLTAGELRTRLLVTRVQSAPLFDIVVVDSDPQRAAAIANEIARQVVLQSPATSQQDQNTQDFIRRQLADLQQKILTGQAEILALQDQIATLSSAQDIDEAKRKLSAQDAQVESWQSSYARLVGAAEPSKTNLVSIASPALASSQPLPSSGRLYYALAVVVGLALGTLLALVLNSLNRAVSTTHDLEASGIGLPILSIPQYRVPKQGGPLMMSAPTSEAAAAYRLLRNSLAVGSESATGITLAVTSSRVAEGKTTTVANLAIALANAGRNVVLVDANLRNPEIDAQFGVAVSPGFGDILLGDADLEGILQPTEHPNLRIVSAGTIPGDYADLLSQSTVSDVIATLARAAEIVLFDTPAVAEERDVLLLTKHIEKVLVVAEAGRIDGEALRETLALLERAGNRVIALALNKVRPPRLGATPLPWMGDARRRARAEQRRRAHGREAVAKRPGGAVNAMGD